MDNIPNMENKIFAFKYLSISCVGVNKVNVVQDFSYVLFSCVYRLRNYYQLLILDLQKQKKHLRMILGGFF